MTNLFAPTKGNLIKLKRSLRLAKLGFDLMDKKKNVLLKEVMPLVEVSKSIKKTIKETFKEAYLALQIANMTTGLCEEISNEIEVETGVFISYRNVMGITIPKITLKTTSIKADYGNMRTNSKVDMAQISFNKAKKISIILTEIENSLFYLSKEIKKTKIRANALKNIVIPQIEENIKNITSYLEEKEREEFCRLKMIKKTKQ